MAGMATVQWGGSKRKPSYASQSYGASGATGSSSGASTSGASGVPSMNPLEFKTEKDPDIAAAQARASDYYSGLDPDQQRIEQMAAVRDLGIGMTREARQNESRRGVSNTGVTDLKDRSIRSDVMNAAARSGLEAARSGQQMQGSALGQIGSLAEASASNKQADLGRLASTWEMQRQADMDRWRAQMEADAMKYQQQMQQQQALLSALGMLSNVSGW